MDEPDRTSALQASPSLPVDAEFSGAVTTPASSSAVREEEQRGVSSDGNRSMTAQNGETSTLVRDDTCSRIVLVLAFWFSVSMTMILGLFGSVTLQLGPSSSLLIAPNPFFVEYIKVEKLDEAKTGPVLYGLHKNPLRDVPFTWSETYSASLPLNFHKEWIYVLSEGSQINISFRVNSPSSLVLVIAEGSESFAQWLGDPSYPNTTLSWNIIHGSGMIRQSIFRSSTYYVAVGNLNSEVVELQVNLRVKTFLYNTTDAYYKCPVAHGPCRLKMAFPKGNAAVLTSPGSEQGMTHLWNVKLSYRPRWITYIVSIGVMSVLMLLVFHLLDNIPCMREEQTRFYGEMRSERVPLLSQKSDDLSSWGSSYDSMSQDDEDDPGSLQGKPLKDGECSNNTQRLCAICFDAPRDCFFLPCGHSVACFECGTRIAELAGTCPICRRNMKKVHHDMNAPLSHYFVYTGHNSYLTGNQISSACSDAPIIKALQRGVRGIELDMWPNSSKNNIHILHGRTLTSPVELIKCLQSIREYAFVASDYPVIITLEDHLTPDLQAKVAEMVNQTIGDVLFCTGAECLEELPSPESLKRRIIISTKPPKEYLETKSIKENNNTLSQKVNGSSDEKAWGQEVSDLKDKLESFNKNDPDEGELQDEENPDNEEQNAAPEYKRLITIHAGKAKEVIKEWSSGNTHKVRRISLNEQKFEKTVIAGGTDIVRFTHRNILRVYPKGTRVDSSNYNPLIGWIHGAQMVAFNMQGHGRPLWLMQGLFRGNGGCGYVKKPDILLNVGPDDTVFDPKKTLPLKKTLKVKLYMGRGWHLDFHRTHFDLYSPPDFYAKVGIAGVPADTVMKKTEVIADNWIPAWNEEFEFPLTVPELALLRVEVHEYDLSDNDDFGGQTCLPVSELRTGIRAVPLHNKEGEKYKSVKLLMRFEFV